MSEFTIFSAIHDYHIAFSFTFIHIYAMFRNFL